MQNSYLQLDQEKKQMELSHKRARFELEQTVFDSARELEVRVKHFTFILGMDLTLRLSLCFVFKIGRCEIIQTALQKNTPNI